MSKDRDKLIAILNELEKDYHAGNIPKEKYTELRERYVYKIKTIDASNRIKSMQDRRNYSSNSGVNKNSGYPPKQGYNPKYNNSNRNYGRKPKGYDELQQSKRYDSNYSNEKGAKTKSKSGTIAVGILCTVILLFAFGAGMAMGIFNMEGGNVNNGFSELVGAGASINDTAFPIVKKNVTSNFNSNSSKYSSNTTSYSSMNYSSYSGSGSSSDSGGSGSYSGGGSDSGGSSDSGGGSSSE